MAGFQKKTVRGCRGNGARLKTITTVRICLFVEGCSGGKLEANELRIKEQSVPYLEVQVACRGRWGRWATRLGLVIPPLTWFFLRSHNDVTPAD